MAWSRQQNPTGVSNPAVRPIEAAPETTTSRDLRNIIRRRSRRRVAASVNELPIAANASKVEGFAPNATSAGQ